MRFALWKDAKGKARKARLTVGGNDAPRIIVELGCYFAKYRDGGGIVRTVATGCRDETAARGVLADLEREAELIKAGVVTGAEANVGRHGQKPLSEHITA